MRGFLSNRKHILIKKMNSYDLYIALKSKYQKYSQAIPTLLCIKLLKKNSLFASIKLQINISSIIKTYHKLYA